MPIRGLHGFLSERKLINTSPISFLKNQRIGIDGQQWLKKLSPQEPYQVATGGAPLSMLVPIQQDLARFSEAGIKPFFVFNGLQLMKKERAYNRNDSRAQKMVNAWEAYYKGQKDTSLLFQDSEKSISVPFVLNVCKYLKENNIEYFRAPYLSWAQLACFAHPKQNMVSAVLGGLELLLFGVTRLIVDIDFEKGTYDWVEQRGVLKELMLSSEQFLDACILAGFDFSHTFPPLIEQGFSFRYACDMVKNFKSGYAAIQQFINNPQVQKLNFMDSFLRTRCMVLYHPVLLPSCICEPLHKESCPSDLHEIIGPQLPNDLYFLLSQGVINPQVVNNLASGVLLEVPPMVDSEEYRRMLNELTDFRGKALGVLVSSLHDTFSSRRVVTIRWYDSPVEYELPHFSPSSPVVSSLYNIRTFKLNQTEISSHLSQLKRPNLSLSTVVAIQSSRISATGGPLIKALESMPDNNSDILTTPDELLFTTLSHALVLRDYLTSDRQPTVLGKALEGINTAFQEECFLILELIKSGYITSSRLSIIQGPVVDIKTQKNERELTLLSRAVSLLPMHLTQTPWTGPLDHDLMGFHEIVKALYRTLRNLLEMSLLALFLSRKVHINPRDYVRLSFNMLPFFQQNGVTMGMLLKAFLSDSSPSLEALGKQFPNCTHIADDLRVAYEFWGEVIKMITFLRECDTLPVNIFNEFQSANKLMQTRRHVLFN